MSQRNKHLISDPMPETVIYLFKKNLIFILSILNLVLDKIDTIF